MWSSRYCEERKIEGWEESRGVSIVGKYEGVAGRWRCVERRKMEGREESGGVSFVKWQCVAVMN